MNGIPKRSEFDSVDPAPPSTEIRIHELRDVLCNEDERMFLRMRALFALRNLGGKQSVDALVAGFTSNSALLKHEIAYVLGQMQDGHAVSSLIARLRDVSEDLMVRHEAAEALGAIGNTDALPVLQEFVNDTEPVISESCEVALDLLAWVRNKRLDNDEV